MDGSACPPNAPSARFASGEKLRSSRRTMVRSAFFCCRTTSPAGPARLLRAAMVVTSRRPSCTTCCIRSVSVSLSLSVSASSASYFARLVGVQISNQVSVTPIYPPRRGWNHRFVHDCVAVVSVTMTKRA
jgi:hypothetical protein